MDTGCKNLSVIHRDYFLDQTRTKPVIFFLTVWLYFASTTFTVGPLFGVVFMMVVFFFSCLWSEGWTDHGRTFSIYLCPFSFWLTLPELCFYWICIHCPCQTQNKYYTNYTWSPVHVLMLSMCGLPSLYPPGIVAGLAQEEMNPVVNLMSLVGCRDWRVKEWTSWASDDVIIGDWQRVGLCSHVIHCIIPTCSRPEITAARFSYCTCAVSCLLSGVYLLTFM